MSLRSIRSTLRLALVAAFSLGIGAASAAAEQTPVYSAFPVPGTIAAVDYDVGGEGISYHDYEPANLGGAYRVTDGVDVRDGGAEGYIVGNIRAGEWLEYTIDVDAVAQYDIAVRFASGGAGGVVHLELGGSKVTGAVQLKGTGSFRTYATTWIRNVSLKPGRGQVLRFSVDSAVGSPEIGNLSTLIVAPAGTAPAPTTPLPTSPIPTSPAATSPAATSPRPTSPVPTSPVPTSPVPTSPVATSPVPTSPVATSPKPTSPVATSPKPTSPVATSPAPTSPQPTSPEPTTPVPTTPTAWPTKWVAQPAAPVARFESAVTTLGGKIYAFGGFGDKSFHVLRTYTSYDVASGTWKSLGTLPEGMAETHAGIGNDGRYIYMAGGFGGDLRSDQSPSQTISRAVRRYDPVANTWSTIAWLPEARGAGALVVTGRKLHYFGGNPADRETNVGTHYVYDLDTKAWSTAAPMPDPKDHFSAEVLGNSIYAFGGEHGHDVLHEQTGSVHAYDLTTGKWTKKASLPLAKSHTEGGSYVADGKIVMAGGQVGSFRATAQVVTYDPATDTWTRIYPDLPGLRQGAIIQRVGTQVVVALGAVATNTPLATVWRGTVSSGL